MRAGCLSMSVTFGNYLQHVGTHISYLHCICMCNFLKPISIISKLLAAICNSHNCHDTVSAAFFSSNLPSAQSLLLYSELFPYGYPLILKLVGGFNPSEKHQNISQLGWLFPIYGKIKKMFQILKSVVL